MENLMHAPIINKLDYQGKLEAQSLINRGIEIGPLYFWWNLRQGNYNHLPYAVKEKDLKVFSSKYPKFAEDFVKVSGVRIEKHNN